MTTTILEAEFGLSSEDLAGRLSERQSGAVPFVRYKGVDNSVPTYCVVTRTKQTTVELIHRVVQIPRLNREYLSELLYTPAERRGPLMDELRRVIYAKLTSHAIQSMTSAVDGVHCVRYEGGEMLVSSAVLDELMAVLGDLQGDKR